MVTKMTARRPWLRSWLSKLSLYQRLTLGYVLAILAASLISWLLIEQQLVHGLRQRLYDDLHHKLALAVELTDDVFRSEDQVSGEWHERLQRLSRRLPHRITLIGSDGQVLAESDASLQLLENHASRPELVASRTASDGMAKSWRRSATVGFDLLYAAQAIRHNGLHRGWVRVAVPLDFIDEQRRALRQGLATGMVAAALLALIGGTLIARNLTRPLARLSAAATAMGSGTIWPAEGLAEELDTCSEHRQDEIGALTRAFASMAQELSHRFQAMTNDQNKLLAVLASMQEGVIAIDASGRILHINRAACDLVDLVGTVRGLLPSTLPLPEAIDTTLRECLQQGQERLGELQWTGQGRRRTVLLRATPLHDASQQPNGAVMVLTDQTERQRLDDMRRDFIANVSHELKTPLTVIQGLLETIADDSSMPPNMRQRFITKTQDHTRRLTTLVSDLLVLSRLEAPDRPCDWGRIDLRSPLRSAAAALRDTALNRGITLVTGQMPDDLPIDGDPEALQQLFENLLSNALRYSPSDTTVRVEAWSEDQVLIASISDQGIGIPSDQHERIFERFYRVDKARSREVGGTGLGLAIVRHVALAHGGSVSVDSEPNRGSTFIVRLPRAVAAS